MAQPVNPRYVTPADELRELLAESERLVVSLAGSEQRAATLLANLDRISALIPILEQAGVDLRPELGRWEGLQSAVRRRARTVLRAVAPSGGLDALREKQHPDGQAAAWWHLAGAVRAANHQRLKRAGIGLLVALALVAGLVILVRQLFPVDPAVSAAVTRLNEGDQAVSEGDMAGALAHFQAAADVAPHYEETWVRLGTAQQALGQTAEAEASYARARAFFAKESDFLLARSSAFAMLGKLDESQADAQAIIAADPDNAAAYYLLATPLEMRGKLDEAIAALQKAAELADVQGQAELTATARYRMGMLMQRAGSEGLFPATVTP